MHNEQKISVNEPEFLSELPKPFAFLSKLNENDLNFLHLTIQRYHELHEVIGFIENLDSPHLTSDEKELLEQVHDFFCDRGNECYYNLGFPLYVFGRSE